MSGFYWQLCDPDRPVGTTFREGDGFDQLVEALRDLTAATAEQTPNGYTPSGNIVVYWSRTPFTRSQREAAET